jgi:hypothetical protein
MTYAQEIAIANLTASAANFERDITRHVIDPGARDAARKALAEVLRIAIAGTEVKEPPRKGFG